MEKTSMPSTAAAKASHWPTSRPDRFTCAAAAACGASAGEASDSQLLAPLSAPAAVAALPARGTPSVETASPKTPTAVSCSASSSARRCRPSSASPAPSSSSLPPLPGPEPKRTLPPLPDLLNPPEPPPRRAAAGCPISVDTSPPAPTPAPLPDPLRAPLPLFPLLPPPLLRTSMPYDAVAARIRAAARRDSSSAAAPGPTIAAEG